MRNTEKARIRNKDTRNILGTENHVDRVGKSKLRWLVCTNKGGGISQKHKEHNGDRL